jgi:hypothetical protein
LGVSRNSRQAKIRFNGGNQAAVHGFACGGQVVVVRQQRPGLTKHMAGDLR